MNNEFLKGLAVWFGIASALCALWSVLVFVVVPCDLVTSDGVSPNRWVIWTAIPATYLTILLGWVAGKLVNCK